MILRFRIRTRAPPRPAAKSIPFHGKQMRTRNFNALQALGESSLVLISSLLKKLSENSHATSGFTSSPRDLCWGKGRITLTVLVNFRHEDHFRQKKNGDKNMHVFASTGDGINISFRRWYNLLHILFPLDSILKSPRALPSYYWLISKAWEDPR